MQDFSQWVPSVDMGKVMLLVGRMLRTKRPDAGDTIEVPGTKLEKCLKTRDLVSLGVGSCVGTGMYLVAPMVAHRVAGPSVVFSFCIAAMASLLSGVCYAEFGVRVPNTSGSAYAYSAVSVGEFLAFVVGWNMILEYLIGTAAGAAALSACLDALYDGAIRRWSASIFGSSNSLLFGHVPDLLAAAITAAMTLLLAAGVRKSLLFNNLLNVVNFGAFSLVLLASLFYIDTSNWTAHGGFAPFGVTGVLNGAATCFYAFIGFDVIATSGEEAENAQRSIPTAIVSSMVIALAAYITSGLLVTLMVPYEAIDAESSLVEMFTYVGAERMKAVAAIGAMAGLVVSMFGSMFPMPRVVYAMAKDGLLFPQLAEVSPFTNTPVKATLIFGAFTAVVAFVMSLETLVQLMSIGTLISYSLVSACVLLLRYQPTKTNLVELLPQSITNRPPATPTTTTAANTKEGSLPPNHHQPTISSSGGGGGGQNAPHFVPYVSRQQEYRTARAGRLNHYESSEESEDTDWSRQGSKDDEYLVPWATTGNVCGAAGLQYGSVPYQHGGSSSRRSGILDRYEKLLMYLFPYGWKVTTPATEESGMYVVRLFGLLMAAVLLFDVLLAWHVTELAWGNTLFLLTFFGLLAAIIALILAISRQPQIRCNLKFRAPGVPFVPAIAILINIYLILRLSILTLVRMAIWLAIGMLIYFTYSIKNSLFEGGSGTEEGGTEAPSSEGNGSQQQQQQQQSRTSESSLKPNNNNPNLNTTTNTSNTFSSGWNSSSSTSKPVANTNPFASSFREPINSSQQSRQKPIELKIPEKRLSGVSGGTTTFSSSSSAASAAPKPPSSTAPPAPPPRPKPRPPPIPPRPSFDRQGSSQQQGSFESSKHRWETFEDDD